MPRINKKQAESAFTLVELLVAIAIMGILTVIALPAVNKIKMDNDKLQYKKYKDSFVTAGKLYNDSFAEDLFGRVQTGCADVDYGELQDKNLIKDIQVPDADCSLFCSGETDKERQSKVRIRRAGDQYYYEVFMCCTKEDDGTKIYETNNASHYDDECKTESSGDNQYPKLDVKIKWNNADPKPEDEPYEIKNASLVKAIVNISDIETGNSCLNKNGKFHYEWLYSSDEVETNTTADEEIADDDEGPTTADDEDDDETDDSDDEEEDIDVPEIDDTPDDDNPNNPINQRTLLSEGDINLSNYINNCNTELNITLNAPAKITDTNLKGLVIIKITPTDIRDVANQRIPVNNTVESTISIDNTEVAKDEEKKVTPEPGAPTVKLYQFTGNTNPSSAAGLTPYKNNTWFAGNVYTVASGGNTSYYRYTVRGKSKNVTKKLGNHRSIKANGTSTIKYCSARTTGSHECVKWSPKYTIRLDEKKPKCAISKSNTGTTSGVTLKTTCKDTTSGVARCAGSKKKYDKKYVVTKKKIKKSVTYTVKDRAGNSNTCKATVTAQRQKRTRKYDSCKTGSPRQCYGGTVKKTCIGYKAVGRYDVYNECRHVSCSSTVACYDPCTYDCSYYNSCIGTRNTCKGGYTSWSSWSNVSSCSESKKAGHNQTDCRTVYK